MRKIVALAAILLSSVVMADDRISISALKVVDTAGFQVVQGVAHNNTNSAFGSATLIFKLYDGSGNMVGNTIANSVGLGAGENWKFSATSPVDFKRAEVAAIQIN